MKTFVFGKSSTGLPIFAHQFSLPRAPHVLVLGGVHGDEPEGVIAAQLILEQLLTHQLPLAFTVVPESNPDGILRKTRQNSQGVDLNRNLPTKNWSAEAPMGIRYFPGKAANSEPETQALVQYLDQNQPQLILSYHSYFPLVNPTGTCQKVAKILAEHADYKVVEDMGYPHPGCLGTFAGKERNIPTITFEVERGLSFAKISDVVVPGFLKAIEHISKNKKVE